jgi:multidrug transporter EmrE-like cation transporter
MTRHVTKEEYLKTNIKLKLDKKMMQGLLIVLALVIVAAFAQILLKKGVTELGGFKISEIFSMKLFAVVFNPKIFFGIILYAISMIFWIVALSTMDVSVVYPLVSMGYIITAIFAMVFLKEQVSLFRWLGISLIVAGSFLILKSA